MLLLLFLAAFAITLLGIKAFIAWSRSREILDIPNERSSHSSPVPVGAGLIISSVVLTGIAAAALPPLGAGKFAGSSLAIFVVSSILLVAVSWLDDLRSVPVPVRFAIQSAAAGAVLFSFRGWADVWHNEYLAGIAAFVWIVGLTNAYNFMDGTDGIAGVQAVTAGLGWIVIGSFFGSGITAALGALLVACSLAFLIFNWEPAKVFMGDSGSAFLGFSLAAAPLLLAEDAPVSLSIEMALASAALVWPFIFDSALTLVRRLIRGERIWEPHRSHLYQAMVINGYRHSRVAVIYAAAGAISTFGALLTVVYDYGMVAIGASMFLSVLILAGVAIVSARRAGAAA